MAIPKVTGYKGVIPDRRTQSAEEFTSAAVTWTDYQATTLVPSTNAAIDGINAAQDEILDSVNNAEESSFIAQAAANYQGPWFSGAQVVKGESWSHNGLMWAANVDGAGEPQENAQWFLLNSEPELSAIKVMLEQWGYRYVGLFDDGFTYSQVGDAGVDADNNAWIYVGAGAPNKVVPAGTVPSVGAGYERVSFNALQDLSGLDQPSGLDAVYSKTFNIVSDMINESSLVDGQRVRTKGFSAVGVGGSEYKILGSTAITPDGRYIIALSNGLFAQLVVSGRMDVTHLGADMSGDNDFSAVLVSAIKNNIKIHSGEGLLTVANGVWMQPTSTAILDWTASGTRVKLADGNRTSAAFVLEDFDYIKLHGQVWDGNRLNTTGNNAGFFVVERCRSFEADSTRFEDLRRYGYNIVGSSTGSNTNVRINNTTADNIGVYDTNTNSSIALGEVLKMEDITNVELDGLVVKNTSGSGNGQMQKCFFCKNVSIKNFEINNASPNGVYPSMSNVANENYTVENVKIDGVSQVSIEDNANINSHYKNIETSSKKAAIMGTDGASRGNRLSENVTIENWIDNSTEDLAFNFNGCTNLKITNLRTNKDINISRDDPSTNLRSARVKLENVKCNNLNTLLVMGGLKLKDVDITTKWTNTAVGTTEAVDVTYGEYTNLSQDNCSIVFSSASNNNIQISSAMDSGQSMTYRVPENVNSLPLSGVVNAYCFFGGNPASQWSMIDFHFYDAGTPTVNKSVIMTGSVARSNITLSTDRVGKTITITNNDPDRLSVAATIRFIDRVLNSLT